MWITGSGEVIIATREEARDLPLEVLEMLEPLSVQSVMCSFALRMDKICSVELDGALKSLQQHCVTPIPQSLRDRARKHCDEVKKSSCTLFSSLSENDAFVIADGSVSVDDDDDDVNEMDEDISFLMNDTNDINDVKRKKRKRLGDKELREFRRNAIDNHILVKECFSFAIEDQHSSSSLPSLKENVDLRQYQTDAIKSVVDSDNQLAQSGIIVLPCGAGKTLVGISTSIAMHSPNTIVLCNSNLAVLQWKAQFLLFTSWKSHQILVLTSRQKDILPPDNSDNNILLITTYSMMSFLESQEASCRKKMSDETEFVLDQVKKVQWRLMLLDEVHIVPAQMFRKVCTSLKVNVKVGLSATLLREDDKIKDLNFLIGPKLFEAGWKDLTDKGFLAKVNCVQVSCPMSKLFFREYLHSRSSSDKAMLARINGSKVKACEDLVKKHEQRGDKILVFCDCLFTLNVLAQRLKRNVVSGTTPERDRIKMLSRFKSNHTLQDSTLLISKVGDVALDIPNANVLIQMSSHFGSRRQEAQRLGRILRPKQGRVQTGREDDDFNAMFYSLVSADTREMYFALKRRQFLVDNGYSFTVMLQQSCLSADEEITLLARVLMHLQKQNKVINIDDAIEPTSTSDSESDEEIGELDLELHQVNVEKITGAKNLDYAEFEH